MPLHGNYVLGTKSVQMFDTISLFLPINFIKDTVALEKCLESYEDSKFIIDKNGEILTEQYFNNGIQLKMFKSGLKISGSIPRFLYGNNYRFASIEDLKLFKKSLEEMHNISLDNAIVRKLDFGLDINVQNNPKHYFRQLQSSKYYTGLLIYPNSITFCNSNRRKILYDKSLKGLCSNNRIRFEIRYKKRYLDRVFKEDMSLKDLFKHNNQRIFIECIDDEFKSISKLTSVSYNPTEIITPKDFNKLVLGYFIENRGLKNVEHLIEEIFETGGLNNVKNVYRLKSKYRRIANSIGRDKSTQSLYDELYSKMITNIETAKTRIVN